MKDTKLKAKISKQQYQVLLRRVMERQQSPSVLDQMMPQPGMGMQPQVSGQSIPLGQQPQSQGSSIAEVMGQSQQMWESLRGGPGEEIWRMVHGNNPVATSPDPEEHFHNVATQYLMDPASVPDGEERDFIDTLTQSMGIGQDPQLMAYEAALSKGFSNG